MTGYGRAEANKNDNNVLVEIKSLNGKQLEMNLKLPPMLKQYEMDIRNMLQESLKRGSLDVTITLKQNGSARPVVINMDLAKQYYQSIIALQAELQLNPSDVLNTLLKLPDVVTPATEQLDEKDWPAVRDIIAQAVDDLDAHRINEGASLEKDLQLRITNIIDLEKKVNALLPERKERVKLRLESSLQEYSGKDKIDQNRFEQEVIYYLEKLDISEEQVRLVNHCNYFKDILQTDDDTKGKKLGFILQEMGREINTTGAKANDSTIQQWVVLMKDELEKAKEQVMNVL